MNDRPCFASSTRRSHSARLAACLPVALCLLAGACAPTSFEARPASHGFGSVSGVMNPYEDGKLQLSEGRPGLAIERFRQALAEDRNSIDALNGLAVAYARLGRTEVAESYLQRALDLRYDDVATLNNYGYLLVENGRWLEARPLLQLAAAVRGRSRRCRRAGQSRLDAGPGVAPDVTAPPPSPLRLARTTLATYRLEIVYEEPADLAGEGPGRHAGEGPRSHAGGAPAHRWSGRRPRRRWPSLRRLCRSPGRTRMAHRPAAEPLLAAAARGYASPLPEARPYPTPFVVVANGVGRNGLAAHWRQRLRQEGVQVDAIANAPSFTSEWTEIRAHPAFAQQAAEIAAFLPAGSRLITDAQATTDIYVELGRDSLDVFGVLL
jgi:hypothetical protein